ncbi:hypothetical protein ACNVED_14875 (plasmid) [Legionella sp. D16C41]|uniref:hypothetical protein n=1 Tax=Legionella sp. D16C41 TaxID=3402688 RepID=UPI003AF86FF0
MAVNVNGYADNSSALMLSRADGSSVELKSNVLNNWLHPNVENEEVMGQYGLQNATQVISFLKTPVGEAVKEMILEELIKIAEQERAVYTQIVKERELLANLLLLLASKGKEDEQFKRLYESTQAQIHNLLNPSNKTQKISNTDSTVYLLSKLEDLEKRAQEIVNLMQVKQQQIVKQQQKIVAIQNSINIVQQHYPSLNRSINNLVTIGDTLDLDDISEEAFDEGVEALHDEATNTSSRLRVIHQSVPDDGVRTIISPLVMHMDNVSSNIAKVRKDNDSYKSSRNSGAEAVRNRQAVKDYQLSAREFHNLFVKLQPLMGNYLQVNVDDLDNLKKDFNSLLVKHNIIKEEHKETVKKFEEKHSNYTSQLDKFKNNSSVTIGNYHLSIDNGPSLGGPPAFFGTTPSPFNDMNNPRPRPDSYGSPTKKHR